MKEIVEKKLTNIELIDAYDKSIASVIASQKEFKTESRFQISLKAKVRGLINVLATNNSNFPESLVLDLKSFSDEQIYDQEGIIKKEYLTKTHQLVEVRQGIHASKGFPTSVYSVGNESNKEPTRETVRELNLQEWVKFAPQIVVACREFDQKQNLQNN
jgi:hypothetical protein